MNSLIRRIDVADAQSHHAREILRREWLITNGLGGYGSGTICGMVSRRYHGLLVAALPAPFGRMVMLNHLSEHLRMPDGRCLQIGGEEPRQNDDDSPEVHYVREFRIEHGVPIWTYDAEGCIIEKSLLLVHGQNTVHVAYRLLSGPPSARLELRPAVHFRPHENDVGGLSPEGYSLLIHEGRYEVSSKSYPHPLRLFVHDEHAHFTHDGGCVRQIAYETEAARGYPSRGLLWSPGFFTVELRPNQTTTLIASTEDWSTILALDPGAAREADLERRRRLIAAAAPEAGGEVAAELVLAADQFIITPAGRIEDAARARAAGDEVRTVIAGYHWFTDWGRDTMISLEGLTLTTGRHAEAAWILRTFGHYIRDGLIPNLFPEGQCEGLYHTADATLWFFHALDRYVETTGDRATLDALLPKLRDVIDCHLRGTRFGIRVDPADGLLRQGEEGYQLTWMDAKVDGWVVTPRRGKAVEINALYYNSLRLLAGWLEGEIAQPYLEQAERCRASFNQRFWSDELGYLLDVVDGEQGDDAACRPNQVFAISLRHPVLEDAHWSTVLEKVRAELLTPVGLRSLAPSDPDFKPRYFGDLRARDAAYHQGTVWAWLIGPFIDAWLKVHPDDSQGARRLLDGLIEHLDHSCVGSINEVFDAEEPYTPRGCIAQAWSVAEVLRCWAKTAS
ncbi:MAG: amylo-alpha-1,6-glucosidase [Chthoniobacteraceae bacterium]